MEVTLLRCTAECETIIEEAYLACKTPYYKINKKGNRKNRFKNIFKENHSDIQVVYPVTRGYNEEYSEGCLKTWCFNLNEYFG